MIEGLRKSYTKGQLEKGDLLDQPLDMLSEWLSQAVEETGIEANAMTLSTVNQEGQPSARIVLAKGIDENGVVFYTNYKSRKALQIEHNNKASLLFFWKELERQVRVEGQLKKVSEERSKAYFQSRPKGSQIGAWASPQSEVISDRAILEDRADELRDIYREYDVLPKPPNWGGYILRPHYFEFWQGRDNRLHDRFEYRLEDQNNWVINRLAP